MRPLSATKGGQRGVEKSEQPKTEGCGGSRPSSKSYILSFILWKNQPTQMEGQVVHTGGFLGACRAH